MLIVYRIFWIVGLIALVAEMVILANPRQVAPQRASDWEIREQGQFRVRAPKRFRVERDPQQARQLSAIGDEVQFLDIVTLSRGERTGMQIVIVAPKQMPPPPQLGQVALADYEDPADWLSVRIAFFGSLPLLAMFLGWFIGGMFRSDYA